MLDNLRQLLDKHARLPVKAATLGSDQDLYAAGLTSFAAVQLMLALEEAFDIEFPERMLNRRSFATMDSIAACISELRPQALAS
ncbi:MAG: acyl carrier protein [Rhodoblastus sp.]